MNLTFLVHLSEYKISNRVFRTGLVCFKRNRLHVSSVVLSLGVNRLLSNSSKIFINVLTYWLVSFPSNKKCIVLLRMKTVGGLERTIPPTLSCRHYSYNLTPFSLRKLNHVYTHWSHPNQSGLTTIMHLFFSFNVFVYANQW